MAEHTALRARQALKDGVTLRVVHVATPEPSPKADVRQDTHDGQQVLILRGGVICSTLKWNDAELFGQALVVAAGRCPTNHDHVHILKNATTIAVVHRDYARELGHELQRVAKQCELEHWAQCERKLGGPVPIKRIFGLPLLDSPQQLERLG